MKKYSIPILLAIIAIVLYFFVHQQQNSKEFSCHPEARSGQCEVLVKFQQSFDEFIHSVIELDAEVVDYTNACRDYFDSFASETDWYYENNYTNERVTESVYKCESSTEAGLFVYYKYRVGDFGGLCYDGKITKHVYEIPQTLTCQ